jgi:tetratricopeptide (TPR) repeat protein
MNIIPTPPAPYTAHPYSLLATSQIIGRQAQIDILNDWASAQDHPIRVLSVVAAGGMGKSALTWKWYDQFAATVTPVLAGRMWWSFYESDAFFENFVIRALMYVGNASEGEVREMTPPEREAELLAVLDRRPFLITLDGLERILVAYARMDAARMDDDGLDAETANQVAGALGVPLDSTDLILSPHRLRKTADPRAGTFLRRLTEVSASRILISTRLYPADLQRATGHPVPGAMALFLAGLDDVDALALWRSMGASGKTSELTRLFTRFGNYPLLIRALAGHVLRATHTSRDFGAWRAANPDFTPELHPPETIKAYVMAYLIGKLSAPERAVLNMIASFRAPCSYDTLASLLVHRPDSAQALASGLLNALTQRDTRPLTHDAVLFDNPGELRTVLIDLEARGLIGHDVANNRYDLHPVVRGAVWERLGESSQQMLYLRLNAHFDALASAVAGSKRVAILDDLTDEIELYYSLIGLQRYDEAFRFYLDRLNEPLRRLSASLRRVELLRALFVGDQPMLENLNQRARALNALAVAHHVSGEPGRAASLYRAALQLAESDFNAKNVCIVLCNLADTLRSVGALYSADIAATQALLLARTQEDRPGEAYALQMLGPIRLARGRAEESITALARAARIYERQGDAQARVLCHAQFALALLSQADISASAHYTTTIRQLSGESEHQPSHVTARVLFARGRVALATGHTAQAYQHFSETLVAARVANLTELEIAALLGLAQIGYITCDLREARRLLDDMAETAARGPYQLLQAESYLLAAQVEARAGDYLRAGQAASAAYGYAWCDGEPYAYQPTVDAARSMMSAWNVPTPDVPPVTRASDADFIDAPLDLPDEFFEGDTASP